MNIPDDLPELDGIDQALIRATQTGLPISSTPYSDIGLGLGLSPDVVEQRIQRMLDVGIIRRIGIIPNHYKLGYQANGMSVWDIEDQLVDQVGEQIGALDFVSHCYRRPRHLPEWPFNLFAMVHGTSRDVVEAHVAEIRDLLGDAARDHRILYSRRILKKTGLRWHKGGERKCCD
ncbi:MULTISPECIES: siroheme decarboxylase subunit beta [Thalassospira]|uniref:siroheme decarboxylase n=2 Tax=Thalassospira TaxID=168934 RepID=A0A367WAG5_9PROT|nr:MULTISPECIES: AsnC family transcriptional regulator [Thalassospira]MDG4720439.1 AsnC family transcriptional regulator [Thalassospira sp. FZY0004]RCK37581.1 protein nirH [Thalassospira profundimaris]